MKYYVYAHVKPCGDVMYIGKGHGARAWEATRRSTLWQRTADKHGYEVVLLAENLPESVAFDLERCMISVYGRRDKRCGTLCNLTDGGEGTSGYIMPDELRKSTAIRLTRLSRGRAAGVELMREMYEDTEPVLFDTIATDEIWETDFAGRYI